MRVTIEKLVYGGAGLARTELGIVFVPRTAPGDVLDVEIIERKADYGIARIVSMLEPSADRQAPECPNYETAGCCHWQHIRYPRQLAIKEEILRETLQRAGRIRWDLPIRIISGPDRHYRLRATFHVRDQQVGFMQERSNTVVPIRECSALSDELNTFIPQANALLAAPEMSAVRSINAVSANTVAASLVSEHGKTRYHQSGAEPPRLTVNGFAFSVHPDAFFQSNRYLLDQFMTEVIEQAGPDPGYVLDLFCGSGFFSVPLARHAAEVLGVESDRVALRQGRMNVRLNNLANVDFFEGPVEATLREADIRPDLVVLNPPRAGCGRKAADRIANLHAGRIVYVSCNPSTFAREAVVFVNAGYELKTITLIDQFPNTYHIEMVGMFSRK